MSTRESTAAAVWLAAASPLLAFPTALGPGNAWLVPALAIASLAVAVVLSRQLGSLMWAVALFAASAVVGWFVTPAQSAGINHFAGIALGLLAMVTIAGWCQTRKRLAMATAAFLLFGVVALSVGFRSTPAIHKRKVFMSDTTAVPPPLTPLPLSGLHAREYVNPNALSAMAMMVMPVAAAVAMTPAAVMPGHVALRWFGAASALWAAAIVLLMQSRSAWIAGVVVFWLWMRSWMGPRIWRVATLVMFLVVPGIILALWKDHPRSAEVVATIAGRMNIWDDALKALQTSPWLGIGLDYFRDSGYSLVLWPPNELVGTPHAHNIFLQTALDIGLLGLAAYVALVGIVLWRGLETARANGGDRWIRYVGAGAALAVVSVHAYGLLDAVALGTKVGVFQWLASGLVLAAWQLTRRER